MDEGELREFIVERLAQGVSQNDVILAVCEKSGLPWADAESLVVETAWVDEPAIDKRRLPLLAILSALSLAGGIALVAWFAIAVAQPFMVARSAQGSRGLLDASTLMIWITSNLYFVGDLVLGAAMIAGGLLGLRKAAIGLYLG